ncbi:permease prefix domain 1-containing protein [Micromonospora sp. NBC_01699]|uniref:permease prefix domain 1-containing protein n=1 Tax=Micromonospora sp. NBC_01699 TaxID=2975984 RepID=UPI002E330AEB|nr:permease prefix domain 1-containing protein [Micromonospora sp. NBC_01699]
MNTLTDRYLAATLTSVPAQRRDEIAAELRGSIEDMIEDRAGNGQDPATAERDVLTELGNPERLAARYADRRLQLIGPTYYLVWARLMRLLLSFVPAIVGTVVAVIDAADGGSVGDVIGSGIGAAIEVAVQIAFWVTLAFAIAERSKTKLDLPDWTVDQLPDAPVDRQVSRTDTVAAVVTITLLLAYLPWQHFRSWVQAADGTNIPIIDPALWTSWLPALIAVLVASVAFEIVKYRVGRRTWPLFGVKVLLDLAFTLPVIWLLHTDRLLNPALVDRFDWLGNDDNLSNVATLSVVITAIVVFWDIVDSAIKTRRANA